VGVLCCVVVGKDPRAPLLRCARPCRCSRLNLLWRACELGCHRRGRTPNPPSPQRSDWPLRLTFFCARARCVVSNLGEAPSPPLPNALGLAAVLCLASFGVRARWTAVVGGDRRTPLLRCARNGRCAWFFSARGRTLLCRSRGRPPNPLLLCARPSRCARLGHLRRACEFDCRSRGRPRNSLIRCARPGRCAWLLWRVNKGRMRTCQAATSRGE